MLACKDIKMISIFVDADACPVKNEIFRVAERYKLPVKVVANQFLNIPAQPLFEMIVVPGSFDAADDWIVEHASLGDIVITADILLADRCVKNQARVLGHKGDEFTEDNVGSAVASRELMQNLRHMGDMRGGPKPMNPQDRSRFLGKLDQIIQSLLRSAKSKPTA